MASVGERLRLLRESRNTSVEEMGVATGIGQSYLEAVERDEVHLLPGKAFGKLYIRAYAEVFGFDPQPWIDDYDREQRAAGGGAGATESTSSVPAGARPVAAAIARWKESRAAAEKGEPVVQHVQSVERDESGEAFEAVESVEAIESEESEESEERIADEADVPAVEAKITEPETPVREPVAPIVVIEPARTSVPKAKRPIAPFAFAAIVAIATALYFGMRGTDGEKPAGQVIVARPVEPPVREAPPPLPPPPVVAEPKQAPAAKPSVVKIAPSDSLTVPESGVGRRVVNARLEGESSEFAAGEVACFQTRVVGGKRGETIRHVWIYDGRAQQGITLRLGGPDWRTHTKKTLYKPGPWTVEARDGKGRVLATASFVCVPPGR